MSDHHKDEDKVKITICKDHFSRLADGNVCQTCPSNPHNESVVMLLAQLETDKEGKGESDFRRMVLSELKSIRAENDTQGERIQKLASHLEGNGKEGLIPRVIKMETVLNRADNSNQFLIMVVGLIVSTLVGLGGLIVGLAG